MSSNPSLMFVLKEIISEHVAIDSEQKKLSSKIMKCIVEGSLIPSMIAVSPLFHELYSRIYYSGSYYDGLRVGEATEFDLNLVLRLPFKLDECELCCGTCVPGYATYQLKQDIPALLRFHPKYDVYEELEKFFTKERFLSQDEFIKWHQMLIAKALVPQIYVPDVGIVNIRPSASGPAKTLIAEAYSIKISIDIVLVIECAAFPIWTQVPKDCAKMQYEDKFLFVVPKTPTSASNSDLPVTHTNILWRISFPQVERFILKNMGCVKVLVKLFKALRDRENWTNLSSYFVKTFFLWEVKNHPDQEYWKEANLDSRFVQSLVNFEEAVKKKEINNFWFPSMNLLQEMNDAEAFNISNRIWNIIREIKRDPLFLKRLFNSRK